MRKYEFVYILDPNLDEAAVAANLERYSKIIRDSGGTIVTTQNWGRRKLAYEIRHKTEGSYLYVRFSADAKTVEDLNRTLHFDENVVRSLIVLDEEAEERNAESLRVAGREPHPEPEVVS